jgi:hypothetical protein
MSGLKGAPDGRIALGDETGFRSDRNTLVITAFAADN